MRRAPRQILRCDPYRLLTMFPIAFTHGHARTLREDEQISREKYRGHFYHGLLVRRGNEYKVLWADHGYPPRFIPSR